MHDLIVKCVGWVNRSASSGTSLIDSQGYHIMRLRFKDLLTLVLGIASTSLFTSNAFSVVMYDQNVTNNVIFGSGNANGGFTTDRNQGVELGLRAKVRFNAANLPENTFNSNGDGTYSFDAGLPPSGFGFAPGSTSTASWNFEWSVNSAINPMSPFPALNALTYLLEIDFDPTAGTNFLAFDPVNQPMADNAVGNNATGPGGGIVDPINYAALIGNNNLAQNSWNMEFFDDGMGFFFDGSAPGIYDIRLTAGSASAGQVAQTSIQVIVGNIPEPTSLALMGLAMIGLRTKRN